MAELNNNQLSETVESLRRYSSGLSQSISILRLIGYGLLFLAALDLIQIFVSSEFRNPSWEYELVGKIVERVAVPLIGVGIVFMGQLSSRRKRSRIILATLSWLMLLVTLLFLLLIPLNVVSAVRIDRQSGRQIDAQVNQTTDQIQAIRDQLTNVTTVEQAERLLSQIDPRNRNAEVQEGQNLNDLKEELSLSFEREERRLKSDADASKQSQRWLLIQNSVKWNIGALVSSALFFCIWRGTAWVRR